MPPGYAPGAGYALTRMVIRGIEKAGSGNVEDVVRALEGYQGSGLVGDFHVEAHNHQTVRPFYVLEAKKPDEMRHELDFARMIHSSAEAQPREINECRDIGSF